MRWQQCFQTFNTGSLKIMAIFKIFLRLNYNGRNRTLSKLIKFFCTISLELWRTINHTDKFSRVKAVDFKVIFEFWTHEQQDLTLFQRLIIFASQNLAVLCVKRPWNRLHFWMFYVVYKENLSDRNNPFVIIKTLKLKMCVIQGA